MLRLASMGMVQKAVFGSEYTMEAVFSNLNGGILNKYSFKLFLLNRIVNN